jgi:hypothetical protein
VQEQLETFNLAGRHAGKVEWRGSKSSDGRPAADLVGIDGADLAD